MRRLRGVCLAALACVAGAGSALAETPPPQLRNKNITVAATYKFVHRAPDGRIQNPEVLGTYVTYVSSAGRTFTRSTRSNSGASQSFDAPPGEKARDGVETREARFQGGKLVSTHTLTSGVGRMIVSFDPGYSSCSANISVKRTGGAPAKLRGFDGTVFEIVSMHVSSTCTIRDGNPFAN